MLCFGCVEEDCVWAGTGRAFYYRKAIQDTQWTGPEIVPDSLFDGGQMFVDLRSVPYVLEYNLSHCYLTDREGGVWKEPYEILDDTYWKSHFRYVLDSQGQGHGAFCGCLPEFMAQDESLEVFYFGTVANSTEELPGEQLLPPFQLVGNHPNPFNQSTLIVYSLNLPRPTPVTLTIYNILGREVRQLVNAVQGAGNYQALWDGKNNSGKEVASGIYLCKLRAAEGEMVRKMVLLK